MQLTFDALAWSEQLKLLRHCSATGDCLEAELARLGKNFDSLRYRKSDVAGPGNEPGFGPYRKLNDYWFPSNEIPVVSFFSGAGGLDLGFEQAGFKHLASIELNPLFCETLRKNRSNWTVLGPPVHSGNVKNRDEYSHLLRQKLGITAPFEGVFHGGPPCQSFSVAANQRFSKAGENFKRTGFSHEQYGSLMFDFVWYILQFKPRAFVIENVSGLLDMSSQGEIADAIRELQSNGYHVERPTVLNAANYGIPQNRMRVFICGSRTTNQIKLPRQESFIVPCFKALEGSLLGTANHVTRDHKPESIMRYMELDYGERDKLGRVDRLNPNLASKTVIAGGVKGGGRSHLHPEIPRTLSVRECARLQTFPDDYVFCGPSARQFTQVGNAVPPLLAMQIARAIYDSIFRGTAKRKTVTTFTGTKTEQLLLDTLSKELSGDEVVRRVPS